MFKKYLAKLIAYLQTLTVQTPDKPEPYLEYSHDIARARAQREGSLNAWIAENAFTAPPKAVNYDGVAMDSVGMDSTVKDAFNLGASNLPQVLFSWFVQQGFIGYQACAVISQHWLVDNACRVPAEDAIKNGFDITVRDDIDLDVVAKLRDYDKEFKIYQNMVEFIKFSRVFGVRICLFVVESSDPEYYLKPFNPDGVKPGAYKGISQVDPYWITPELNQDSIGDPSNPDFYEPTWWRISGKRYHKSHLIITRHTEVADVLKPSYIYGGVPLTQKIYERVYAAERTANEAPQLAMTKRMNVVKTDMEAALANQSAFEERLSALNNVRDNYGVYAIDADDSFEQTDTALTDLDALIMTQYQIVASIAGMPATKLLGTTPKGFNATGNYEQGSYYDMLEGLQLQDTMLLERHYLLLQKSLGLDPVKVEITWKPLESPSPSEIADINNKNALTDQILQSTGAVDGEDIRERIIDDKLSGFNGLESFEFGESVETDL